MKKIYISVLFATIFSLCRAQPESQFRLLKNSTLKVDPASFLVNEFRVWYQRKLFGKNFFFLDPFAGHWYSPKKLQRQSWIGVRTGVEKFFFTDYPPAGTFLRLGLAYRFRTISFLGTDLQPASRIFTQSAGGIAAIGKQWIFSPWKDLTFAAALGAEYYVNFYGVEKRAIIAKNWYQLPFVDELRIFLSLEVGFTFRQKNRRW